MSGDKPPVDPRVAGLSPEKRALLARRLQERRDAAAGSAAEPIAIVGMACRFPGGADSPDAFWSLLVNGGDAISEVPRERWDVERIYDPDPLRPGFTNSRHGGFLDGIDRFDAGFFGISPREACRMDPQQRLFLEVAWDALDDAGQDVDRLAGTDTGVFAGLHSHASDYFWFDLASPERMDAFTGPGTSHNIVTGRLSYLFDFQGPSIIVDTACSSSLVAIHLACQSLRAAECSLALAGGVNLVLSPQFTIALTRLQVLSPDGHCRPFDAGANGFVRSEGCGVIVLKRLADARAAGDRVLAIVRGSAVNQDGRTNGITAPNSQSQQRVIERALASAGVTGPQIGFVEAHGTGTALGDPIEIEALTAVIGQPRPAGQPCLLGSGKANVGHLEGAAGVAGVIKAVLTLQHQAAPPLALFQQINPHISLDGTRFEIPTTLRPWDASGQPRFAGVSSFGWSGTNAHAILEEAAAAGEPGAEVAGPWVLPISARSEAALRDMVAAYGAVLASKVPALSDLCHSAGVRRTQHDYRVAIAGATREELATGVRSYLDGDSGWRVSQGRAISGRRGSAVFVFSGQGPQWWGMGRELLAANAVFHACVERCASALATLADWSLIEVLTADEAGSRLHETAIAQPALCALQLGLAAMWESWGIVPAAVIGHSVGEIAAAVTVGALTLEEGMRVAFHRGREMQRAPGAGRMSAVEIGVDEAGRAVRPFADRLSVAAVNAATSSVLSGDPAALETVVAALQARGVQCRPLPVNYAFHSVQMEPAARALASVLGTVTWRAPRIPLVSTVTGAVATGVSFDAGYWSRNVRQLVLFAPAVRAAAALGHRMFVEVGPHPVLTSYLTSSAEPNRLVLPSLHRGRPEQASMLASLGGLYAAGYPVDWRRVYPAGRQVPLPRYPWQRERYWLPDTAASPLRPDAASSVAGPALPGRRVRSPQLHSTVFEAELTEHSPAWLADHRVNGAVVVPAAAFVAMAVSAARGVAGRHAGVGDLFIQRPLSLGPDATLIVQTILTPDGPDFTLEIQSLAPESEEWTLHVSGRVVADDAGLAAGERLESVRARCPFDVPVDEHYGSILGQGADLRPLLQTATRMQRRDGEALARLDLNPGLAHEAGHYALHPTVLDGCLQPILAALPSDDPRRDTPYLPQTIARVRVAGDGAAPVFAHAVLRPRRNPQDTRIVADVRVLDTDGAVVALLEGVAMADASALARKGPVAAARWDEWLYSEEWVPAPVTGVASTHPGEWLVFVDRQGVGDQLIRALEDAGQICVRVTADRDDAPGSVHVNPGDAADLAASCAALLDRGIRIAGLVHLWSLDVEVPHAASADRIEAGQRDASGSALALIQSLVRRESADAPTLLLVTRGAHPAGGREAAGFAQASVWGLARVAALEHPDLRCVCVDLDPQAMDHAGDLVSQLLAGGDEVEVAFRHGARLARRLTRSAPAARDPRGGARQPVALEIPIRGVLDNLALVPVERRPPGPGEIEIEVRASGLNFRDVLNVLGMYPGDAGRLGSECAGRISAIGDGVTGFRVGEDVMALADGAMATHVVTAAYQAVRKPARLSFEAAASLPIAYLTAEYALHDLAGLSRGDSVLIHAAAGGVGLAAVQIAHRAGAEVYATAGSPEKHAFLHALGVKHVFSSRSLDFAADLLEATGGRGVDVALNSLAGEFIPRTLSVLAPSGRFIEIGKTGIWGAEQVGASRPDVAYHALYLGEIMISNPARTQAMLHDLARDSDTGWLPALPVRTFDLEHAADAFRHMAQARHIGKVVLSHGVAAAHDPAVAITPDATYLITGGAGSLGLHVARWLVDSGARHLVLAGRHAPAGAARAAVAALQARGAQVTFAVADVASRADVDRVLGLIQDSMPALRGVVHAAGVLDDGVLLEQDWARVSAVMAPKVRGAWNLHQATADIRLDFFVLFSSIASALGSPGQSGYAAANAFLDALAHHRQASGQPALSINWGPWKDDGMAAAAAARMARRWSEQGLRFIVPDDAISAFGAVLGRPDAQLTIVNIEWPRYLSQFECVPAALERMAVSKPAVTVQSSAVRLSEMLASAPPVKRFGLLVEHVRGQALRVLGLPASHPLDPEQGLRDVGLDSLMAVELRNQLQAAAGQHLPTTLAFDYPTVTAIATHLALVLRLDAETAAVEETAPASDAADMDDLSDAEAEALLSAELGLGSRGWMRDE